MATPKLNNFIRTRSKILKTEIIADEVVEITFEKPKDKNYTPGQFVGIWIKDGKEGLWYRSYSLLSDDDGNLQICVKKFEGGRGSTFLHTVKQDDILDIIFPLGYFGLPEKLADNLVFVTTGTGIVPILSLLENLPQDYKGKVQLFFGVRHEKDIFYDERIKNLENKITNFSSILTLSKPIEEWQGPKGRVTEFAEKEDFSQDSQCFMCGSSGMIRNVREILEKKGIKKQNIFYEDFN